MILFRFSHDQRFFTLPTVELRITLAWVILSEAKNLWVGFSSPWGSSGDDSVPFLARPEILHPPYGRAQNDIGMGHSAAKRKNLWVSALINPWIQQNIRLHCLTARVVINIHITQLFFENCV
jgi:hypothetical protein